MNKFHGSKLIFSTPPGGIFFDEAEHKYCIKISVDDARILIQTIEKLLNDRKADSNGQK